MLGNLLTAGCLFSLNMIILVLAGLLRMLPSFLKFIRNAIRMIMNLSIRFYNLILTRAAPIMGQHLGINILKGFARIIATILISLVIGLFILGSSPLAHQRIDRGNLHSAWPCRGSGLGWDF